MAVCRSGLCRWRLQQPQRRLDASVCRASTLSWTHSLPPPVVLMWVGNEIEARFPFAIIVDVNPVVCTKPVLENPRFDTNNNNKENKSQNSEIFKDFRRYESHTWQGRGKQTRVRKIAFIMVAEVEERYTCKRGGSYKQLNPLAIFRHFSGTPGPSGFGASTTARGVLENWVGKGKVAVVTGPYSGIGLATARELARKGCEVVLAGRKKAGRGKEWVEREILSANKDAKITQIDLDLTSLASVRHFASEFRKSGKDLNILVNNAGVMAVPFSRSKEGHELQFATNHLGHFLLTSLLLDRMKESARKRGAPQGRIVNVSSW